MKRFVSGVLVALVPVAATLGSPAPALGLPVINEILYDAESSDDGKVFVEIWGMPGLSLDGYTLEGVNGSNGAVGPVVALAGAIPADGFFVVADGSAGVTEVANADLVLDFDFQNGPDSVVLRAPDASIADALGYGVFGAGDVFAGERMPAPDPASGQSLARIVAGVDTDDNAVDFAPLELPDPGTAAGSMPIPEPDGLVLFALALAGLSALRRS